MEEPAFRTPEEEIQYLEQKILEKRREMGERPSRDAVRETIGEHVAEVPASPKPISASPMPQDSPEDFSNAVGSFVHLAFNEGIQEATRQVRKTHNPYLIDAFHDALVDKFHDELVSRGLLESDE